MTTPQPGAGAGQAQSPSLIPSAPTQNSLRPLLLLSASTLKVLPQMPLKSVTPQSCCEVYTQGKGKLSEESLPCSVTLSTHETRQSSVQGTCVDFKTGNAIQPFRRKSCRLCHGRAKWMRQDTETHRKLLLWKRTAEWWVPGLGQIDGRRRRTSGEELEQGT